MTDCSDRRLDGLEPDNLLAFMALLGVLRILRDSRPEWRARAFWSVDAPPVRPVLRLNATADRDELLTVLAVNLNAMASLHEFSPPDDLKLTPDDAARKLRQANGSDGHISDLWSALVCDVVLKRDGKQVEPTPLCLMFGQGHQHFLSRLDSVPQKTVPPHRGSGRNKVAVTEAECLRESLFDPWSRPDRTESFRWDPNEDVRYALRARDPSKTKETTQHGANRLAAVGLSALTVVPRLAGGKPRLGIVGGKWERDGGFAFSWPIWRAPLGLSGIRALLGHPDIDKPETRDALGVFECRRARRVSTGKFMNFTRAEPRIPETGERRTSRVDAA